VSEVLRRSAQHGRAADVDHLDRLLLTHAVAAGDVAERVEVDADQIERANALLVERGEVLLVVSPCEDRRVDARVERLHAATEHLGHSGQLLDALDVEPDLGLEEVGGAAAGDQLAAELGEPARELLEAPLVVDGDQRAQSCFTTSRRTRCSAA
jgi:hypothetical protein